MKSLLAALLLVPLAAICGAADSFNVVWDSPSKDHQGSMPLGNGDISLNAWVETSGELVFYIGKTDSRTWFGLIC